MAVKKRTQKTSPNLAGNNRRIREESAHVVNLELINQGKLTPWQVSKHKRAAARRKRKFVALIDPKLTTG